MKPHKHAELIKAWADGAEIEYKSKVDGVWCSTDGSNWEVDYEYRVKPESKYQSNICVHAWYITGLKHLVEAQGQRGVWSSDDYMRGLYNGLELALAQAEERAPNFKPVFLDGETGKLKSAEVLK